MPLEPHSWDPALQDKWRGRAVAAAGGGTAPPPAVESGLPVNPAHVGPFTYTGGTWDSNRYPVNGNQAKLTGPNGEFRAGRVDKGENLSMVIVSGQPATTVGPVRADPIFFQDGIGEHDHTHFCTTKTEAQIRAESNSTVRMDSFVKEGGTTVPVGQRFWIPSPTIGGAVAPSTVMKGNTGYWGDSRDLQGNTGAVPGGGVTQWPVGLAMTTMDVRISKNSGTWRYVCTFPQWFNPDLGVNPTRTPGDAHPHMRFQRNNSTGHTVLLPRVQWFVNTHIPDTDPKPGVSSEIQGPFTAPHAEWVWSAGPDFAEAVADLINNNQKLGRISYYPN